MNITERWMDEFDDYLEEKKEELFAKWSGWLFYQIKNYSVYDIMETMMDMILVAMLENYPKIMLNILKRPKIF